MIGLKSCAEGFGSSSDSRLSAFKIPFVTGFAAAINCGGSL